MAVGTLSTRITSQLQSLQGLHLRLRDIGTYLQKVIDKELPVNHAILGNLQDVFNLLPNLSNPTSSTLAELKGAKDEGRDQNAELARAMSVKTNDQLMSIYLSSLIRAITAFHDLIENKIQNRQQQEADGRREDEDERDKDKEKDKDLDFVKSDKEANSSNQPEGDSKEHEDRMSRGKGAAKKR